MAGLLFDASSLVDLLVADDTPPLRVAYGEHSLDLALYEAGNAVWNIGIAQDQLTDDEIREATDSLVGLAEELTFARAPGLALGRTMSVARNEGLTFYDSAYLVVAQRDDLTLVTEDEALREAAGRYVPVATVVGLGGPSDDRENPGDE